MSEIVRTNAGAVRGDATDGVVVFKGLPDGPRGAHDPMGAARRVRDDPMVGAANAAKVGG